MNYFYFVGIDAAKDSFDATILRESDEQEVGYKQFVNNEEGITDMLKWVKSFKIKLPEVLICAENMGVYVSQLAVLSKPKKYNLALGCPLSIKKSMGIARGKNDRIDSQRIAYYALKHHKKLSLYVPESDSLIQLSNWYLLREHWVKEKVSLSCIISTMKQNKKADLSDQLTMLEEKLNSCLKQIKEIEDKMKDAIASESSVKKNFDLLTSIVGVGLIVATVLLTTTSNFTKFSNNRQYACYCGIAPFEHSSGTSIRGKTKVSKEASIKIKTIINSAANSAQQHDKQLKSYTKRKLEEGKNKWTVKNAVRNKIIARCFAVIRRGTPYVNLQP